MRYDAPSARSSPPGSCPEAVSRSRTCHIHRPLVFAASVSDFEGPRVYSGPMPAPTKSLGVVLFPRFELLDVFGPLEMLGYVPGLEIVMLADEAGAVRSTQGPAAMAEHRLVDGPPTDLLLVPGGLGTRPLVDDAAFLDRLRERAERAELVLSVCTGSGLLARAGLLDGRRATSNKRAFAWASAQGSAVTWVKEARWVWDDKFVTSSGVAAGIDMALAVVDRLAGTEFARSLADQTEYAWQSDASRDPFARIHGLLADDSDGRR